MGRSPCCTKVGLRRGPWSAKEDALLANHIHLHGEGQWRSLPKKAGLLRCGKSCRLRWMNYLRPGIKRGNITEDEEDLIVRLHGLLGNRWSLIAGRLPGRTDNEIKNYWNTHLLKKLTTAGVQLKPHKSLPKPPARKEKKKKPPSKKKSAAAAAAEAPKIEAKNDVVVGDKMTKVYLPKPIRVSSAFSRTNSYDSLSSSEGSAEQPAEVASYVPWSPLFELEEEDGCGGDFMAGICVPAAVHHRSGSISDDVDMWERVYDEYLQLL